MSSPRIVLHHCPGTRSMRSLWLLYELGIPFELRVHAFDKSLRSSEFLRLSPAGRVPALEIGSDVLSESGAIAELLCERFPAAGLGRGADSAQRACYLSWSHFAETISVHVATLTQQHIMLYEDWMRSPTLMQLEVKRLAKCAEAVEARLRSMAPNGYLLGAEFSAVDIGIGQALWMAQHFLDLSPFVQLQDWRARIEARPAFQRAVPLDGQGLYTQAFYAPWPVEPPVSVGQ